MLQLAFLRSICAAERSPSRVARRLGCRSWFWIIPAADYVPTRVVVVVLRRDWEFLFQQLKSTDAVVRYLHRVKDMSPVALGDEAMRYYALASADAVAAPPVFDPRLVPKGARHISTPLRPREPAGHTDQRYHLVIRAVLEDIALARWQKTSKSPRC
jgi:hypothetical protein